MRPAAKKSNRLFLFYVFIALYWGCLYAYMSFFTPYVKSLGASDVMAGLIVGGYGLTQMVLRVPLGILSDKMRRRKPFVCMGMAAGLLAAVGMYLFPSPVGLLIFRAFCGVSAAAWVTSSVLFSSYFDAHDAPKAMGRLQGTNTIGITLASLVGAQIAQRTGESNAFLFAVGLGAVGLTVSFFLRENRPAETKPLMLTEVLRIGMTPTLLGISVVGVLLQTATLGTSGSFTQEWAYSIGMTTGQMGYVTLFTNLPNILASMFLTRLLLKRLQPRRIIMIGASLIALALATVPLTRNMYALFAVQSLQGLGTGLAMPMLLSLALLAVDVERRGVAMGFYQSIYALGMFMGPLFSGMITANASLPVLFRAMSGIALAMVAMAAVMLKRKE